MMNQRIPIFNMNWTAGDNYIVALYYEQKRQMFGDGYNLRGFDYYDGGVFEFLGHSEYPKVNSNWVKHFDWRERHGANDSLSLYWDGDILGTGWLTSVKDQGKYGTCWAFSAVGLTEVMANLFANDHLDFDLSEQYLISCDSIEEGDCSGGNDDDALVFMRNSGIVTEQCFPYDSSDCPGVVCADKCDSISTIIQIFDTIVVFKDNHDSIRSALITKGPLSIFYNQSGTSRGGHFVNLVGYDFDITDNSAIWVIKNSLGLDDDWGINGFCTLKIASISRALGIETPVFNNGDTLQVNCLDMDGDSLYFWGIGPKPKNCKCSDIEDCDDNNPLLGGYDENYNCTCLVEYNSIPGCITEDTTWESIVYLNHEVIVDSGACLTIKSVAHFSSQSNILVKQGGKLIIDGGTLTNACPETLWEGIVVYGYDTAQYYNQYFGVVNVINEGTIENARIGISTNYCPLCENPQSNGGGIIRAEKAIFRNYGIAVEFNPFRNIYQGLEKPYMASFKNCLFEFNEYLQDGSDFKYFVKFNQVNGIRIQGCDFIGNSLTFDPIKEETLKYSSGIYSVGSQFYVEDACLSQSAPCTLYKTSHFRGLNYGIYALGIDGRKTVSVKKTFFDQNKTGIYLSAVNYATVVQDTFEVKLGKPTYDTLCGLYMDYCKGYQIEENIFHGDYRYKYMENPYPRVGVAINNSGEQYNEIYNNRFDSLYIGTLALNKNRNEDGTNGLQIKCNDFTNGYFDIAVTAEESRNESGVAKSQGSNGALPTSPANNTFSDTSHVTESNYFNDCLSLTYWHVRDTISAITKPKYHSEPEVDPQINQFYNQLFI
jgi:hypothetical protein